MKETKEVKKPNSESKCGCGLSQENCRCKMLMKIVAFPLKVFVLVLFASVAWYVIKIYGPQTSYITVSGSYMAKQSNNIASYYLSVQARNSVKDTAVADVNKKTDKVLKSLKDFGINDTDIKTSQVNIYQEANYNNMTNQSVLGDWNASTNLEVILREVDKSGVFTDMLATMELSTMNGPNFAIDDSKVANEASTELLEKAMGNAQAKAGKLAAKSGKKLGSIVSVTEGYATAPYLSMGLGKANLDAGAGGAGFNPQPGSSSLSATVTVTYILK